MKALVICIFVAGVFALVLAYCFPEGYNIQDIFKEIGDWTKSSATKVSQSNMLGIDLDSLVQEINVVKLSKVKEFLKKSFSEKKVKATFSLSDQGSSNRVSVETTNVKRGIKDGEEFTINNPPKKMEKFAKKVRGKPYSRDARKSNGPNEYDCSGLVLHFYKYVFGIDLAQEYSIKFNENFSDIDARRMNKLGRSVSRNRLKPGDMVFFNSSAGWHVGIAYSKDIETGEDFMLVASSSQDEVVLTGMNKDWYDDYFVGARRIINYQ